MTGLLKSTLFLALIPDGVMALDRSGIRLTFER